MQSNKSRNTQPELAIRRLLHARGLRYSVASRPLLNLNRTADILFRRAQLAIFVDGCFWHGCPLHFRPAKTNADFWSEKLRANVSRDHETTVTLHEYGWVVMRVWEHEDPTDVADEIERRLRLALKLVPPKVDKPAS